MQQIFSTQWVYFISSSTFDTWSLDGDAAAPLLVLVIRRVGLEIVATAGRTPEALANSVHRSLVVGEGVFTIERFVALRADPLKANKQIRWLAMGQTV